MEQNQPLTNSTSQMPPPPKKWTAKEIITVIFLVLIPIVGLILMWAIANWSKKVKIIITVILLVVTITIIVIVFSLTTTSVLKEARHSAMDARIRTGLAQTRSAAEMYYRDQGDTYSGLCENLEVEMLLKDIASASGATPFCETDGDTYCIHFQMASDPSTHNCISSDRVVTMGSNPCTADLRCN